MSTTRIHLVYAFQCRTTALSPSSGQDSWASAEYNYPVYNTINSIAQIEMESTIAWSQLGGDPQSTSMGHS
jgi:hypothetical protein